MATAATEVLRFAQNDPPWGEMTSVWREGLRLREALQAGDQLFCQGFAGFGPQKTAGDVAVFFDGEGEGEEHLDVLLDVFGGFGAGLFVGVEEVLAVFGFVEDPGRVEAEVDTDVAVLLEGGVIEGGAEAEDADRGWRRLPEEVEFCAFDLFRRFRKPEIPLHLELVGGVLVEEFGGFGYGVVDDGGGGVCGLRGARVEDELALVDGGLGKADRVGGGRGDARKAGDAGELTHDRDERGWERGETEVGEPEGKVELIGHKRI